MGREIMMILRWLWFCLGLLGWVLIVLTIWHKMGWIFGVFLTLLALLNIAEWTERMLLKQWKMRKITSYEDD
jgi:hypothetical protein